MKLILLHFTKCKTIHDLGLY